MYCEDTTAVCLSKTDYTVHVSVLRWRVLGVERENIRVVRMVGVRIFNPRRRYPVLSGHPASLALLLRLTDKYVLIDGYVAFRHMVLSQAASRFRFLLTRLRSGPRSLSSSRSVGLHHTGVCWKTRRKTSCAPTPVYINNKFTITDGRVSNVNSENSSR